MKETYKPTTAVPRRMGTRREIATKCRPGTRKNFIDSHVHIWSDDFAHYPLAPGFAYKDMHFAAFPPSSMLYYAQPCGVSKIMLVQMTYYGSDNAYILDTIRRWPNIFRGIAVVDPAGDKSEARMRELAAQGVRGFRIYAEDLPHSTWIKGKGLAKMFRCGAADRLALCLLVNPADLQTVGRLCEHFPETPVIIDHMARIGRDGPIREFDIDALCALARYHEVKVKISAFYALGNRTAPHLDLAPLIKRLVEAFGSRRLLWGSDSPFQLESETYEDGLSLICERLEFLSEEDKDWILRRTAFETFFL